MTMQPSDSQPKFIFDLKYTKDDAVVPAPTASPASPVNKQEDCKIVITIANAKTLLNKLNELKKENSVDNEYKLDSPIEIKYRWLIKIPKKGYKEILSFKCEITHIIPKKKKFRIRKKLMNEKSSLVKLRDNFTPKKFFTTHRFSSLCIVNNDTDLILSLENLKSVNTGASLHAPTTDIDVIIEEALKESEEIKNNNATRVKSRQDTATSKLAVAGMATAGVLALGPIGFFLGVSLIYAGLFAAMAHSFNKIDKQEKAVVYLNKKKKYIDELQRIAVTKNYARELKQRIISQIIISKSISTNIHTDMLDMLNPTIRYLIKDYLNTNINIQNAENTLLNRHGIHSTFHDHLKKISTSIKNSVENYSDIETIKSSIKSSIDSEDSEDKKRKYILIYVLIDVLLDILTEKNTSHDILIHINSINEILDSLPF